jgi:hypothetical protein
MSVSLQIALAEEPHLADGLTLKLWLTVDVACYYSSRYPLQTETNMEEKVGLLVNALTKKRA